MLDTLIPTPPPRQDQHPKHGLQRMCIMQL